MVCIAVNDTNSTNLSYKFANEVLSAQHIHLNFCDQSHCQNMFYKATHIKFGYCSYSELTPRMSEGAQEWSAYIYRGRADFHLSIFHL